MVTSQKQALELLAKLERFEGLRCGDALRLGLRLLVWTKSEPARIVCEEAVPDEAVEHTHSVGRHT